MGGDPFKKVLPGQKLQIPAEAFNGFIDAAAYVRARQHNAETDAADSIRQTSIVRVRNTTDEPVPRFGVLTLGDSIIQPEDNESEFKNTVAFDGSKPEDPVEPGKYAIVLEPLDKDTIGRGIVAGVTPVKLKVNPEQLYDFAEVEKDTTARLINVPHGSARVLWVEDNEDEERWAVVRIEPADFQAHVFIQSNKPDDEGFYPGVVQRYKVATGEWETLFDCKVLDINQ